MVSSRTTNPALAPGQETLPSVSILIASRNRQQDINRCLQSILTQPTRPRQIIVVDQSERKYDLSPVPGLIHLHCPNLSGLTAARNAGIICATSDVIFFLDDDCELLADCVQILARAFIDQPNAIAISCTLIAPQSSQAVGLHTLIDNVFELGFFSRKPVNSKLGVRLKNATGVAGYRRSIFEYELFDENLTGYCFGEDWEFSRRASRYGYITRAVDARVLHHVSPTNRLDVRRGLINRWKNYLYFYDKLADDSMWDRFCRLWWMVGQSLTWTRVGMGLPFLTSNRSLKINGANPNSNEAN